MPCTSQLRHASTASPSRLASPVCDLWSTTKPAGDPTRSSRVWVVLVQCCGLTPFFLSGPARARCLAHCHCLGTRRDSQMHTCESRNSTRTPLYLVRCTCSSRIVRYYVVYPSSHRTVFVIRRQLLLRTIPKENPTLNMAAGRCNRS